MNTTPNRKITTPQMADYFQVDKRTIANWRARRLIPYVRINSRVIRYDLAEVEKALRK